MFPPSAIERDGMLTLLIIVCLFASAVGAFLAFRKRRVCWIAATFLAGPTRAVRRDRIWLLFWRQLPLTQRLHWVEI
jgi:hypothetical protein